MFFDYLDGNFWCSCIWNLTIVHVIPKRSALILAFIVKLKHDFKKDRER